MQPEVRHSEPTSSASSSSTMPSAAAQKVQVHSGLCVCTREEARVERQPKPMSVHLMHCSLRTVEAVECADQVQLRCLLPVQRLLLPLDRLRHEAATAGGLGGEQAATRAIQDRRMGGSQAIAGCAG